MDGRTELTLDWEGDKRFSVAAGDHRCRVDGDSDEGLSPMQFMATAVAGCMAIDIAHVLGRMRTEPVSLRVSMDSERAPEPPRYFTELRMHVDVVGDVPQKNLDRAIELSREKYCSAIHTLRSDLVLTVTTDIRAAGDAAE